MKKLFSSISLSLAMIVGTCAPQVGMAQQYQVPVSEAHEPMQTGKYQPT